MTNVIREKSFKFALDIINLFKQLNQKNEFIISKQLMRSGTSIGANIEEGLQGQSRADFISKLSISLKEAFETRYWLELLKYSHLVDINVDSYLVGVNDLISILTKIIKTTKNGCNRI